MKFEDDQNESVLAHAKTHIASPKPEEIPIKKTRMAWQGDHTSKSNNEINDSTPSTPKQPKKCNIK